MDMKTFDQRRQDFTPYGFSAEKWIPQRMPRPDRHNEIELNLLKSGSLTYLMAGRKVEICGDELAVFWAAIPHQIIFFEGSEPYLVATIPLAWFLQWKLPEPFVRAIMSGEVIKDTVDQRSAINSAMFERWTIDLLSLSAETRRTVQLEMEACIRRIAFSCPGAHGAAVPVLKGRSDAEMSTAERLAAYVARHYTEKLTLAEVGRAMMLHPNYIAGLFRSTFGTTFLTHVNEYRISHAQRLLVTTDQKVLQIALASGFNSLSRFNAVFKKACGCTPREYRRRHYPAT